MASKNGSAAAAEARGAPGFDLLASGVAQENNSASAQAQATASRASRPGGAKHRQKGDRTEREIVDRHKAVGVHAERYPLSGASRFRGSGHDLDVYAFGREEAPLVCEVKARRSGAGFVVLEKWLAEYDARFLRRNQADPLICIPWRVWVQLLERVRR
jgi:Holliday junction resolvase